MKDPWKERIRVFNSFKKSVTLYEVKIWGWKNYESVENLQEKNIKWAPTLYRNSPGYIIRREKTVSMMVYETIWATKCAEKLPDDNIKGDLETKHYAKYSEHNVYKRKSNCTQWAEYKHVRTSNLEKTGRIMSAKIKDRNWEILKQKIWKNEHNLNLKRNWNQIA